MRRSRNASRLAVIRTREMRRHGGTRACGMGDRVADQMGEGHLGIVTAVGERLVQLAAAAVEHVDTNSSERGCSRNVPAALHVVDQRRGRPLDWLGVLAVADTNSRVVTWRFAALRAQYVGLGDDASRARTVYCMKINAVPRGSATGERCGVDVGAVRCRYRERGRRFRSCRLTWDVVDARRWRRVGAASTTGGSGAEAGASAAGGPTTVASAADGAATTASVVEARPRPALPEDQAR